MRKTSEELQALMEKEGVDRIWSWSRLNCFKTSPYEYFLKYIKKIPEDNPNSIYPSMGGICHEILEKYYTGEIKYEDMVDEFESGWTVSYNIAKLKFDRNDEEHNEQLAKTYYDNLKYFFMNHTRIKENMAVEKFIKVKVGDNLFQGYIDGCFKDMKGYYNIIDFKTSSLYRGEKAKEEAGQLVLYAMALNQVGIPLENIRICWNFLKYCNVTVTQKNGKKKKREIARCKLGESLQKNTNMWLKAEGYDNADIEEYLRIMENTNSIEGLPDAVREKYEIEDCYVYVNLNEKLVKKWEDDIISTIKIIKAKENEYEKTHDERVFYDTDESVKANSYYFSTLCGFSGHLHIPYQNYLLKLEREKKGDVFASNDTVDAVMEEISSWLEDM